MTGRMIGFDVALVRRVQAKISAGAPPEYKTVTAEIRSPPCLIRTRHMYGATLTKCLPYYNQK